MQREILDAFFYLYSYLCLTYPYRRETEVKDLGKCNLRNQKYLLSKIASSAWEIKFCDWASIKYVYVYFRDLNILVSDLIRPHSSAVSLLSFLYFIQTILCKHFSISIVELYYSRNFIKSFASILFVSTFLIENIRTKDLSKINAKSD